MVSKIESQKAQCGQVAKNYLGGKEISDRRRFREHFPLSLGYCSRVLGLRDCVTRDPASTYACIYGNVLGVLPLARPGIGCPRADTEQAGY